MPLRQKINVSELVGKYRIKYPRAERKLLRTIIRLKNPDINTRTLDRHLRRSFEKAVAEKPKQSEQETAKVATPYMPKVFFNVTQRSTNNPHIKRQLPNVGFNIFNPNNYPIKVKVEARVILGGKNLGLVRNTKGYYSGETEWNLNPSRGYGNASFDIPTECVKSMDELNVEICVTLIGPDDREHKLLPESWTYMRKENDWFAEPGAFASNK